MKSITQKLARLTVLLSAEQDNYNNGIQNDKPFDEVKLIWLQMKRLKKFIAGCHDALIKKYEHK